MIKNSINREEVLSVQRECLELFKKKNSDYGNSFAHYGALGIIIRLRDKFKRCESLISKKNQRVYTESLRDTFIDIANYSLMAIVCIIQDDIANIAEFLLALQQEVSKENTLAEKIQFFKSKNMHEHLCIIKKNLDSHTIIDKTTISLINLDTIKQTLLDIHAFSIISTTDVINMVYEKHNY